MAAKFVRKCDYRDAIDRVKRLQQAFGDDILPIPGENGIICYYHGKPMATINDTSWNLFGKEYYDKFTNKEVLKELRGYKRSLCRNWKMPT